jgi:hypothetical protein
VELMLHHGWHFDSKILLMEWRRGIGEVQV